MKLEDLLKIKKAEVPSGDDWRKFDEELHRKMFLAAIDQKPRRSFAFLRRPAAAIALLVPILALGLFFTDGFKHGSGLSSDTTASLVLTSLPQASKSFAVNELSSDLAEFPLDASLGFSEGSRINYVSASLSGGNIAF